MMEREEDMSIEEMMENCTHNCATCHSACGEQVEGGVGKLEKTLTAFSEVDSAELLKALEEIAGQQEEA